MTADSDDVLPLGDSLEELAPDVEADAVEVVRDVRESL